MGYIHPQDQPSVVFLPLSPAQYKALLELGYGYPTDGLSVKQYALAMKVTSRTVYEWLLREKLIATKTPGGWRIFGHASS